MLIYRVDLFPDFASTAAIWRDLCRKEGVGEIYLAMVQSFGQALEGTAPDEFGCDAAVQFPPHGHGISYEKPNRALSPHFHGDIFDYEASILNFLRQPLPPMPRFSTVMPAWDNTARRTNHATIFDGASPGAFQAWFGGRD